MAVKKPKKEKSTWLKVKAIRFDAKKLKECKKKGNLHRLPEMCRAQLDILVSED